MILRRAFLVCLVLSACASFDFTPDGVPQSGKAIVNVVWSDNPAKDCHGDYLGCSYSMNGVCTIIAARPRSFSDVNRVETFGHEALHCLGANHEWH